MGRSQRCASANPSSVSCTGPFVSRNMSIPSPAKDSTNPGALLRKLRGILCSPAMIEASFKDSALENWTDTSGDSGVLSWHLAYSRIRCLGLGNLTHSRRDIPGLDVDEHVSRCPVGVRVEVEDSSSSCLLCGLSAFLTLLVVSVQAQRTGSSW